MDFLAALDATTPTTTYVIGGAVVVAALIAFTIWILRNPSWSFIDGCHVAVGVLLIGGITFAVGQTVQRHDQGDVLADYLATEHHLTATDPVTVRGHRATARVVTTDGTVKWAEVTWVSPNDVHRTGGTLPDGYDPVTVNLTSSMPATR